MDRPLLASRSLLFPGPQPPLTHLGATLLRHVIGAGLRYALYQLALPLPEGAPVRIARLRIYLDARGIEKTIGASSGGTEVLGALLDPGGTAASSLPGALAGAAGFHRFRLRLGISPPRRREPRGTGLWHAFRDALSDGLPGLEDAFLAETLAALDRRAQRRRGREMGPVTGRAAWSWRAGRRTRLEALGPPDLYLASWATEPPAERVEGTPWPRHPLRGRFRESYRALLDELRPSYLALAARAFERGLLDDPEDAFFVPLDLASDLELDTRPAWIEGAVAANRAEYESRLDQPAPPESLRTGGDQELVGLGRGGDWELAPLHPLA